jgi:hypothetical protein
MVDRCNYGSRFLNFRILLADYVFLFFVFSKFFSIIVDVSEILGSFFTFL